MPSWSELFDQYRGAQQAGLQQASQQAHWLDNQLMSCLGEISQLRGHSTVIFYASAFLQKKADQNLLIEREDVHGFMNAVYGEKNCQKLTLMLHTPGGDPNAVESIVEYLHAKFAQIEVVVPYLAMSGGAMISLASDLIIIGRQGQLGPIDPQFFMNGKTHSARAIQETFLQAKKDVESDVGYAHFWAPFLQSMAPSLLVEAEKALSYSKELVTKWLQSRMFKDTRDDGKRKAQADTVAAYFNAEQTDHHGQVHVHGQRIGMEKLQELEVKVEALEGDQELQDKVLTAYHLMTLIFDTSPPQKTIATDKKMWVKRDPPAPRPPPAG